MKVKKQELDYERRFADSCALDRRFLALGPSDIKRESKYYSGTAAANIDRYIKSILCDIKSIIS